MNRLNPSVEKGLTSEQALEQFNKGLNYTDVSVPTKTIKRIIREKAVSCLYSPILINSQ